MGGRRVVWAVALVPLAACLFPDLSDLGGDASAFDGNTPDVIAADVADAGIDAMGVEAGVPDGAILYFPFEEGAGTFTADKTGHANNGTLIGGSALLWTTSGKIGNALQFNAAAFDGGALVDVPNSKTSSLDVADSFTVTAWIFATSAPVDDAAIVSSLQYSFTQPCGFQLDTTIDKGPRALGFKIANPVDAGGGIFARYGSTVFKLQQWYFVAGVYDGAAPALHVYVDGQLDDGAVAGTVLSAFPKSTLDVHVGHRPSSTSSNFTGTIDEVRVYPRALTATEIAGLYLE